MKPSDFQKTVQCRFESCLKKVVRSVVKDYYKELNRRKNKEISFSELPDVLVDKMAVWDDYETDYTIFSVCGIDIRVLDDELAEYDLIRTPGQNLAMCNMISILCKIMYRLLELLRIFNIWHK